MGKASVGIVLLVTVLVGCGSSRPVAGPENLVCGLSRFLVDDAIVGPKSAQQQVRQPSSGTISDTGNYNVLALSAGGQLGVFGAGFLLGWREAGKQAQPVRRDQMHVVTGVSAGALLATHAFVGDDQQPFDILPEIGTAQLLSKRLFSLPWANALLDDAGKTQHQRALLTDAHIDRVANAAAGRSLYIGVVDLDSGKFLQVDMVKLAREIAPVSLRNACYRAIIGASTAIPVLMGPKFVDGMMLVDGSVRRHVFVPVAGPDKLRSSTRRRILSIVNADLRPTEPSRCESRPSETCNGIIPIAARVAELVIDQGLHDSLRALETQAHAPAGDATDDSTFETYFTTASTAVRACQPTKDRCGEGASTTAGDFCVAYMRCLANAGREAGRSTASRPGPWMPFDGSVLQPAAPQRPK